MSAYMNADQLQRSSDAILGGTARCDQWCYATTSSTSGLPTLVFDPIRDAESLTGCFAQIWIANLDCVLDEHWLAMVRAIRRKRGTQEAADGKYFFLYHF